MDHDVLERSISADITAQIHAAGRMSYKFTEEEDRSDDNCLICINRVIHLPGNAFANLFGRTLWIRISVGDKQLYLDEGEILKPFNSLVFNSFANLSGLARSDEIDIQIYSWDVMSSWYRVGRTSIRLGDLVKRPFRSLLLQLDNGDFMVKKSLNVPTELHINVIRTPVGWPAPMESPYNDVSRFDKHVMIITRGTRGDVQPFVALAIGLAEQRNWLVTICTELAYKDFIMSHSRKLSRGGIRFRPSGGDTSAKVSRDFFRWALHSRSVMIQTMILARTEAEFFTSEPIVFWWAELLQPSAIIYGFTMASIAMILSEKLNIPMLGFILQPTVIPSSQYPPLESLSQNAIPLMIEDTILSHGFIGTLKSYLDYPTLTALRRRRGLAPTSKSWNHILEQSSPIVVPINEVAFGGRPNDWPSSVVLTDFIYLTSDVVELEPNLVSFLDKAKADSCPVVVIGFSSMPIPREDITKIVIRLAEQCQRKPRIVSLLGDSIMQTLCSRSQAQLDELISKNIVFQARGAPFNKLFERADCVVIHGGLGATSEAMRASIPIICTGVLLMDQRFWGNRCKAIGIAPDMKHISAFTSACVSQVDDALAPDNGFLVAARQFGPRIQAPLDPSGVTVNVRTIAQMLKTAVPIKTKLCKSEDAVAG